MELVKLQILKLLRLSILSYMPYVSLKSESFETQYDIELLKEINNKRTDTQGFICYDKTHNTICIVFRGSHGLTDLATDLKFMKSAVWLGDEYPIAELHKGFNEAWKSVEIDILLFLNEYAMPETNVIFVGHSLGAAVATIGAARLIRYKPHLVTFGSPRVGDRAFKNWCNKSLPSHRVVLDDDLIPHIPFGGYHHIKNMIHLTEDGKEISNYNIFRKLWYWIRGKKHSKIEFNDHSYYKYEKALEKWNLY